MSDELLALYLGLNEQDETVRENVLRAPFGYPGSKERSVEKIGPYLPHLRGYCEPFGGSGAVLISRTISKFEVFNDRYAGVTSFYRVIRDRTKKDRLVDRLAQTVHSREEFQWCRDTWQHDVMDDVERAARWYYALHYSFGKQGRNWARARSKTTIFGRALHNNLALFPAIHNRFFNVQVENLDWRICLADFDGPDMCFYLDPPYVSYSENMYEHTMTAADHDEMCQRIFKLHGYVALSGYFDAPTRAIYDKYPWDDCITWTQQARAQGQAFETVSGGYAGKEAELARKTITEGLWIKEIT